MRTFLGPVEDPGDTNRDDERLADPPGLDIRTCVVRDRGHLRDYFAKLRLWQLGS